VKSLLGIEAKILSLVGRRLAEAGAKRINNNNLPEDRRTGLGLKATNYRVREGLKLTEIVTKMSRLANWTPLNGQEKMLQAITIGVERRGRRLQR
jgi:hypothetical protein